MANWGKVNLVTRPRRFGKTLNMSMLKYFFEVGGDKSIFFAAKHCVCSIWIPAQSSQTTRRNH